MGALLLAAAPDLASAATQPSTTSTITPHLYGIAVYPGYSEQTQIGLRASGGSGITEFDNLRVTVDTSKLPAGATLSIASVFASQCTTSTGSVVCSATEPVPLTYVVDGEFFFNGGLYVTVGAAADASYGLGSLTVSATADGLTGMSTSAPVGIAEPVKLVTDQKTLFTGPPGSTYSPQWTTTNVGATTVHRMSLLIQSDRGFNLTKHYSNCLYDSSSVVCTFDNDLAPGVTYEVSEPVTVQIAADHEAPFRGFTFADWLTPLDVSRVSTGGGTPGTDGPLGLVVQSTQAPAPPLTQSDLPQTVSGPRPETLVDVNVTGVNPADLAAIGTSVPGPSWGGPVAITVGVFNQGPAAATIYRAPDGLTLATVTLPTGTTATAVPLECAPYVSGAPDWQHPGKPGFGKYDCLVVQGLAVDQNHPLPFTVQVPAGSAPRVGSVTVLDGANPAGNAASIVITPQLLGRQHGTPDPTPIPRR
jgi:hypothetical protein